MVDMPVLDSGNVLLCGFKSRRPYFCCWSLYWLFFFVDIFTYKLDLDPGSE